MTIEALKLLKESEDKVEFKAATRNYTFDGGSSRDQSERRKCFLGYVVAFANEGGGMLVMGMADQKPHDVVGTDFAQGKVGELEDETYSRLGIRVRFEELYEGNLRVLITHIPSRPVGKTLKFEGVPLMRVGESLRNMNDEELFSILSEQEPDFSATICAGLSIADLDESALSRMKDNYAKKRANPAFATQSNEQILSDLELLVDGRLTFAALILVGKVSAIRKYLPQCKVIWEYRSEKNQIRFDARETVEEPLFLGIEKIWQLINQPAINRKTHVQIGAYIYDIQSFSEEVVREAILNAIAHRDYSITSEVVIKQTATSLEICNPGGFPKGVNLENLVTVSSTPRSRRLTEVLEKAGLVERSGQGVDKIFSVTLSEGKKEPDYSSSDNYQVTLRLDGEVFDPAFYQFLAHYEESGREPKLGVHQIITLAKIRDGAFSNVNPTIVAQILQCGLIERLGSHTTRYALSEGYHRLNAASQRIGKRYLVNEVEMVILQIQNGGEKLGNLTDSLQESLTRNQIRLLLTKLADDGIVMISGQLKGTRYGLAPDLRNLSGGSLVSEIVHRLRQLYSNDSQV